MEVFKGQLGIVGEYSFKLEEGKLKFAVDINGAAGCDELAKLIPGHIDDAILAVIKAALP